MAPPAYAVGHTGTAKCPELLCLPQVLLMAGWRLAPPRRALPLLPRSYELMRQTSSLFRTSCIHTYFQRSWQVAASPCWELSLQVFPRMLEPLIPSGGRVHPPVTSPNLVGLPQVPPMGRLPESPRKETSCGGCCEIVAIPYVQASWFARHPGLPYRCVDPLHAGQL
jgi:hypothetical protein